MILSRLSKHFLRGIFNTKGRYLFSSGFSRDRTHSQIIANIRNFKNINDFFAFFTHNKQDVTTDVMVQASLKATQLTRQSKRCNPADVIAFISTIEKLDLEACNDQDLLVLYRTIVTFEQQRFFSSTFREAKKSIQKRLEVIIKQKQYRNQKDLAILIDYYVKLSDENSPLVIDTVIPYIHTLTHTLVKKKQKQEIAIRDITLFMKAAKSREVLSAFEQNIRFLFLITLRQEIASISTSELVQLCIYLNEMDHLDLDSLEVQTIKQLFKKLEESVVELHTREILMIVGATSNNLNIVTLNPLYKEIIFRILQDTSEDGQNSFQKDFLIEILIKITNKIKIRKHLNPKQQLKFFAVIKKYIQTAQDRKSIVNVNELLASMLENRCISNTQKERFKVLVDQLGDSLSPNLIYQLQLNGYDVTEIAAKYEMDLKNERYSKILRYGIVLGRLVQRKDSQQLSAKLEPIYRIIQESFKSTSGFISFIDRMQRYDNSFKMLSVFNSTFPQLINRLQNPFEVEPFHELYALQYLQFMLKVQHKSMSVLNTFLKANEAKIDDKLLQKIILKDLVASKYHLTLHREVVNLIHRRLPLTIQNGNFKLLRMIMSFLVKYSRFFIANEIDNSIKENIWSMIHTLIKGKQKIEQINLKSDLQHLFMTFINKKFKGYHFKASYKQFLTHMLNNLPYFEKKQFYQLQIIQEGLRLNLATKDHCRLQEQFLSKMTYTERYKYYTLADQKYVVEWNSKYIDIEALVFNPNCAPVIESNLSIIQKEIQRLKYRHLENIIINFNQKPSKASRALLQMVLKQLISKLIQVQGANYEGILARSLQDYTFMMKEYKVIFNKVIEYYDSFPTKFVGLDAYTVIQLAKFVTTQQQVAIKLVQRFYELIDEWLKAAPRNSKCVALMNLATTSYFIKPNFLSYASKIIEINFEYGVKFFLYHEELYSEDVKHSLVEKIAQIIQQEIHINKESKRLVDWYYSYLKVTYPKQMSKIELNRKYLPEFKYSFKPNITILTTLQKIANILKIKLKKLDDFRSNEVYEFNNTIIIFISPLKNLARAERKFIKKGFKVIYNIKKPVFDFVNSVFDQSHYVNLILKQGLILSKQQVQTIRKESNLLVDIDRTANQSDKKRNRTSYPQKDHDISLQ